ncbi:MAG: accessory factor UbiK family protein [Betaproteobacteria bacterium]|nr:accessory factor UbiK family protein [Betaproteobacteria bacterium]
MESPQSFLNDLQQRLKALADSSPARDVEKNVKALLGSAAARLDLVPREELDAALRQLQATREQLAALEARVAKLEASRAP